MIAIRKLVFCGAVLLTMLLQTAMAQITAPNASGSFATTYSDGFIAGGGENDLVYVFCGTEDQDAIGELQVDAPGCTVNWFMFDGVSYQPMGVSGNIATGLTSGGYMAQVDCAGTIECFRAWVWVNRTFVDVAPIAPGCEQFTLNGSVDALDTEFTIQDPPGTNFLVDENTEITVCFWADHTFVSDIGFYLKSPDHADDEPAFPPIDDDAHEVVELLPAASDWGPSASQGSWTGIPWSTLGCTDASDENTTCQPGDNVVNFCFTTALEAGNPTFTPCVCDLPTPLSGTFASVGPWSPIYGSLAGDEGWNVQIYDCEGIDTGHLNRTTLTFTGMTECGSTTFMYDSGDVSALPESEIADNSCSAATASSFVVPPQDPPGIYTVTSSITSTEWACTGSTFSSTDLNPVVTPGTSDFPSGTSDFSLTVTETINAGSNVECEQVSVETFVTTPSDATITPIAPLCYNATPVLIEVADAGGDFSISPSAGANAIVDGVFYPGNAGPGTHTIYYDITGACPSSDQIDVVVYEHISIENFDNSVCSALNDEYQLSFNVNDQDGVGTTFQVNSGSGFTTYNNNYAEWFPSPSNYSLTITDMNGCDSYVIEGYRDCGCVTFAGTMNSLDAITLCQGQCSGGLLGHNNDDAQDGDDVFEYILHDGSAYPANPSTIFATQSTLDFCFQPGMTYGTTYFISAICGNNDGTGHVDVSDPCYSQSVGTPIVWLQNPIVNIVESDISVCGIEVDLTGNEPGAGMIGTWSASGGNFVPVNETTIHDYEVSVLAAYGDYTFTWTINNGPCTNSDNVTVHFNENPNPFAGNDTVVCGTELDLNASLSIVGSTGAWSASGITFSPVTAEDATATLNSGEYGTYILTWTESLGACMGQDYMSVTFVEEPQPTVFNSIDTVCGVTSTVSVANSNYPGIWRAYNDEGVQIFPSFTPNNASPTAQVEIANYLGIYETVVFEWTETNSQLGVSCENSVSIDMTFVKEPNAFVGDDNFDEVCGSVYTLGADTTGSGWATGTWVIKESGTFSFTPSANDPAATVVVESQSVFGDSAHAQIPIIWQMEVEGGCFDVDTMWVTFYKEPVANAGLDDSICGLQYDLEAFFSLPDTSNYTAEGYWQNLPDLNPSSVNFNDANSAATQVNVGAEGVYYFLWRENNSILPSCHSMDTVRIEFKEIPFIDAGDDFDVCGNQTCLNAVSAGYTFNWQPVAGVVFDDINDPTTCIQVGGYGTYTFDIVESNDECVSTESVDITFWRRPSAEEVVADDDTTVCGLVFPRLRAENPGGGVVGNWIAEPGNGVTFYNQSYNDTVEVNFYGHYVIRWVESTGPDNEGPDFCTDTSGPVYIHFIEIPEANAGPDTTFCGYFGTLDAELSVPETATGSWIDLSGNIIVETPADPNSPVESNVLTPGHMLVWTEDNMSCTNSDTVIVGFARIPVADMAIIPPRCYGEPASIKAKEDSLASYTWEWNGGAIDSIWPANAQGGSFRYLVNWDGSNDTSHVVGLVVENYWGCQSLINEDTIYEPYMPQFDIEIFPDTCALGRGGFSFLPDTTTDNPGFSWVDTSNVVVPVPVYDTVTGLFAGTYQGVHSYRTFNNAWATQYIDLFGTEQCIDTFNFDVDTAGLVYAEIAISSATDLNALVAPNAEVWFDNLSDGDDVRTSCTWYFGDGESANSCDEQMSHVYTTPNDCYEPYFVIKVRNIPECRDTAFLECLKIDDMSKLEVPNIFSPNGDGMNDFFQVKAQTLQSFEGKIVNRWGRTIFEWTDYETYEAGWDGKLAGGGEAASGVYYYIVKAVGIDGLEYDLTGPLHLVKEK